MISYIKDTTNRIYTYYKYIHYTFTDTTNKMYNVKNSQYLRVMLHNNNLLGITLTFTTCM